MFTLDLNYQTTPKQGLAPFTMIGANITAVPVWLWRSPEELTSYLVAELTEVGDNYQIAVPAELETVVSLKQGEKLYRLGDDFSFDFATKTITISKTALSPSEVITYTAVARSPRTIKTTDICDYAPGAIKNWNAFGSISYSRSFTSHPSASFEFYCCQEEEESVRARLCNGTKISLFGLPLIVNSLQITRFKQSSLLKVDVSLSGIYSSRNNPSLSPLDAPIRKRDIRNDRLESFREVNLSLLANKAGLNYLGVPVEWWQRGQISVADTTTFRQELESRIAGFSVYAFYSNPKGVEGRQWGSQATHILPSSHVLSDEQLLLNGHGQKIDGVKLSREYERAVLQLDFPSISLDKKERGQLITRYEFENTNSVRRASSPHVETPYGAIAPPRSILRNMSVNFDQGGPTKTIHRFEELNGQILRQETKVFGYKVASFQPYFFEEKNGIYEIKFSGGTPSQYWGLCKSSVKTYYYDRSGYLIREETSGFQSARAKQESEQLEAISALIKADQAADVDEVNNFVRMASHYEFKHDLPIRETVTYTLESLRDYFSDIKPQTPIDEWIEPLFLSRMQRNSDSEIVINKSDYDKEKIIRPLVVRKTFREEQRTTITSTDKPERFVTRKYVQNTEGEYAKNALRIVNSSESIGRPSVHSRTDFKTLNRSYLTILSEADRLRGRKIFIYTKEPEKQHGHIEVERESISFPGIFKLEQAIEAARTQLSIANSREAETLTLDTLFRPEFQEGDFVWYKGVKYVIFSLNATIQVDKGKLRCDRFSLSLGRYVNPPVYTEVRDRFGYRSDQQFKTRTFR